MQYIRTGSRPHRHRRHRGMVIIWVALLMMVLIGFVGLAVDWGYVVWSGQKLQNAADAAALAGAQNLGAGEAAVNDAAVELAAANEAGGVPVTLDRNDEENLPDGDVVVGVYDRDERSFTPTLSSPNAVRVFARRTAAVHGGVPLLFGPIFNKDTGDVSRFAIAIGEFGPSGPGIILLRGGDLG